MSALALYERDPKFCSAALKQAEKGIPVALTHGYSPEGAYSEGVSYWTYGTTYSILSIEALRGCGYDSGFIHNSPGFLASGNYVAQGHGTSGLVFSYGDSRPAAIQPDQAVVWMARENRNSALLSFIRKGFENPDDAITNRFYPLSAFWLPSEKDVDPAEIANHFQGKGKSPIAIHRTGTTTDDLYLGIKGGMAAVNHGHMDAGSFVLDFLGHRWASDLGMQDYNSLEQTGIKLFERSQKSRRWSVFRLNNHGHNTLTYNDQLHRATGYAEIISSTPQRTEINLTMALGLPEGANATRVFDFDSEAKTVEIKDSLHGLNPGDTITWNLMTPATATKSSNGYSLSQEEQQISLALSSPQKSSSTAGTADPPPADYDAANPGISRVILTSTAGNDGIIEIKAVFRSAK